MIKVVIGIFAIIGIFDVLLIFGCAKLEKMRGEDDGRLDKEK